MKKLYVGILVTVGLILPMAANASQVVAPSPLDQSAVSFDVSVTDLATRAGNMQLAFSSSYKADFFANAAPGDLMESDGSFAQQYDDTTLEGVTRLFYGITQSMAAQVVAGNRWSSINGGPRFSSVFAGAGLNSSYTFDFSGAAQQPGDGRFAIVCAKIRYNHTSFTSTQYVVCSETFQLFSSDRPALPTVATTPTISINNGVVTFAGGTWSSGSIETLIYACRSEPTGATSGTGDPTSWGGPLQSADCHELSGTQTRGSTVTNLSDSYIWRDSNPVAPYTQWRGFFNKLVAVDRVNTNETWARSSVVTYTFSVNQQSPPSNTPSSGQEADEEEVPPPVYFGGPLLQGSTLPHFTQGEEGTVTLTGKRMNKITSATINGAAVTVTADRRSATITVPATLAAGTYDLVLQTTNGRLTVMRFIKVS